ncbi:efflux RND transporter permease subunit [Propionivibrio sp.]|uniref:efflux RND transporter permease subunit n=1 Tax=Propionivibrio sp. TaxID=2212460 RepID=UPI00260D4B68|nr:efflux RND transporter permease subunit [Propionivibrio sp.]
MTETKSSLAGKALGGWILARRLMLLVIFILITLSLVYSATRLRVDAGFQKTIPLSHPYMQSFTRYQGTFGGANYVLVALMQKKGDIFTPEFFTALKNLSDDIFFMPGIDRSRVSSIFSSDARYIEIVEEGFLAGPIVPARFGGTPAELQTVRENILKSNEIGGLVAKELNGALVRAELFDVDPASAGHLDYPEIARQLEHIREKYETPELSVHIVGFAKAIGDIADGARQMILFFGLAFLLTSALLYGYFKSAKLAALTLLVALLPVLWLLGTLPALGYGIAPLSILVPFLIFSIGVSHAVQMVNAWMTERSGGADSLTAARCAFSTLFIPGALAMLANAAGFLVIMFIEIEIVREFAITASLGILLMLVANKVLLPILLSATALPRRCVPVVRLCNASIWHKLAGLAKRRHASWVLIATSLVLATAFWQAREMKIGDLGTGIPELREDSRYNLDTAVITRNFSIGADVLSIVAQTHGLESACLDYEVMSAIDRFGEHMQEVDGVQSVLSLTQIAKRVNVALNQGNLKWHGLPSDPRALAAALRPLGTHSGLFNSDCSAMQIIVSMEDHLADTIRRAIREAKTLAAAPHSPHVEFKLAGGNVGIMAATNETIAAAENKILAALFASISLLCLIAFRSIRATLCMVLPLALAALLCTAFMASAGIGLKPSTLPVIAFGIGIGVDYGIYLYGHMQNHLRTGMPLHTAFADALRQRGSAIAFTALTMAAGVAMWGFADLKFQADMGILLAFMFLANLVGALVLLPALAAWVLPPHSQLSTLSLESVVSHET